MKTAPDSHPSGSSPEHLPREVTPFVGRQRDLAKLRTLLADPGTRLVSILGPGGMGKTRLAQEMVASLQGEFQDGVIFIPLAQVNSGGELLPAVAAALDIYLPLGSDLRQVILEHVNSIQAILVLDNFDHLLDTAPFIHDILAVAPQVKALVTSREKLSLQGEVLYHLNGLEIPSPGEQGIEEYDAIHLFLQRARQARPGFELNAQNISAVAQICRLVEGMPLGILLAAGWMEHFSPQEIANQIGRSLDFLSQELRDVPVRHRSMRAVFDASFDRLEEAQQSVFCKLAVFRGGFNLEAAEAVSGADWKTVLSLAEKSLLQRNPDTGRCNLHELLHQYAREKLIQAGDREKAQATHASHYLGLVNQLKEQLKSHSQAGALDAFQADFENIGLAWNWAVAHRDLQAIALAAPALYAFCDMRSRFYEGEALFGAARRGCAPAPGEKPHPAWALALLSWYDLRAYIEKFDSYQEITAQAESCLTQGVESLDPQGMAASHVLLGAIVEDKLDYQVAIQHYQHGIQLYPELENFYWITMRIGLCYQAMQDYEPAVRAFQEGYRRANELGERVKMGWALLNIGETRASQGNRVEAEQYLLDSRSLFEAVGTTLGILWANYGLCRMAREDGHLERARELAEATLQAAQQIHYASRMVQANDLIAQLAKIDTPATLSPHGEQSLYESLSKRELEVMRLLQSDLNGPEIAQRLYVSLNTVRYHTKNIYRKLQVNNRREAIRRAQELGI